jgi:hypothetical protein
MPLSLELKRNLGCEEVQKCYSIFDLDLALLKIRSYGK